MSGGQCFCPSHFQFQVPFVGVFFFISGGVLICLAAHTGVPNGVTATAMHAPAWGPLARVLSTARVAPLFLPLVPLLYWLFLRC